MSVLVWVMTGIALWHFAVFAPDHFWGGIVGAFVAAIVGALVVGMVIHVAGGSNIDNTSVVTMLEGAIGAIAGLTASYIYGIRTETAH